MKKPFLSHITECIRESFLVDSDGELRPQLFGLRRSPGQENDEPEELNDLLVADLYGIPKPHITALMVRFAELGASEICYVGEAYQAPEKTLESCGYMPTDDEVLFIAHFTREREMLTRASITRGDDGKRTLGEFDEPQPMAGGKQTGIFMRAQAKRKELQ
jgi:hypothetical protein